MPQSKPHRRLSITRPFGETGGPADAETEEAHEGSQGRETTELQKRLAHCEERLGRAERSLNELAKARTELQPDPDVTAAPFCVRDPSGRMLLEVAAHGSGTTLRLFNAAGQPAAVLTAQAEGGGIGVLNAEGKLVATVFVHADGGGLSLRNREGELVATSFAHRGGGALSLFDPRGNVSAALGATPEGGRLDLNDPAGRGAVRVAVRETGGDLALFTRGGRSARTSAEHSCDREPEPERSAVHEPLFREGQVRKAVGVYVGAGGGVIETYDRDGTVLTSHPPRSRERSDEGRGRIWEGQVAGVS